MQTVLAGGATPEELYKMPEEQLRSYMQTKCDMTEKAAETAAGHVAALRKLKTPPQLAEELYQMQILFLLPKDPEYPEKLKHIPDAPFALYMKGNREAARRISRHSVAIIGARECSEYGKYAAGLLGRRCGQIGLPVVSGMAYGVDGLSQWAAVSEGAPVAAVLGSGVDVCYPYSNRKLYDALTENGCIYSEYIPGTEPKATNFPPRNRIISGMADALIVVEAKEKSGTLITVDMALEQGKEVYVVPGRINDPMSKGCNRLVGQGASVVCDVDEVLVEILQGGLHNTDPSANADTDTDLSANAATDAGAGSPSEESGTGHAGTAAKPAPENPCPPKTPYPPKNPYPPGCLRHVIYRALDMQPKSVQQIYESPVWAEGEMEKPTIGHLQTELFYMQMEGRIWESGGRFVAL